MEYTLSLNDEELELLECALTVQKTKWLKERSKAINGKSDISLAGCTQRIGQIFAMLNKITALY